MAAGLGLKTFVTGDVLTAADTNGYLMQGVWVFASAAARSAAVTSPQEGNFSFLKDTNSTEYYDGAAWTAVGGGGKVLQVVYGSTTSGVTISSTTMTDSGLTATITPSSTSSKVLAIFSQQLLFQQTNSNPTAGTQIRLLRGATAIFNNTDTSKSGSMQVDAKPGDSTYTKWQAFIASSYLDSPATTSATTYKIQACASSTANSMALVAQGNASQSNITLLEIGA